MPATTPYTIYTDGACLGNPGPGGYGAILRQGQQERELSGGFRRTTNNRMELTAAIVALEGTPPGAKATLYSDSNYLVQAINLGWARSWKAKGWRRSTKEKALNPDLWERLLQLLDRREVTFVWVRGHAGHPENERCDRLSVAAAQRPNLPPDPGFEGSSAPAPRHNGLFSACRAGRDPPLPFLTMLRPVERQLLIFSSPFPLRNGEGREGSCTPLKGAS